MTDDDFAPALGAASRTLIAAVMVKAGECGFKDITPAFASLMPHLDPMGAGTRAQELAQRLGVTKQAMSQLIRELQTRGYVEQVSDPTDTRAKLIRLTKRGIALRAACHQMRSAINEVALRALGPARLKRLQKDLVELAKALATITAQPPDDVRS